MDIVNFVIQFVAFCVLFYTMFDWLHKTSSSLGRIATALEALQDTFEEPMPEEGTPDVGVFEVHTEGDATEVRTAGRLRT